MIKVIYDLYKKILKMHNYLTNLPVDVQICRQTGYKGHD